MVTTTFKIISEGIGMESVLERCALFRGLDEGDLTRALKALRAEQRRCGKNETVLSAGQPTEKMGLVLSGSVTIESSDLWGNRSILSHVGPGQFFAETYALLEGEPLLVDVRANESTRILFLRPKVLTKTEGGGEPWQTRVLANLLGISAEKNLRLSARSFHTAPKTIRGRLMSYLYAQSVQQGRTEFSIPFDRQQMADYLNVERTALSKELGKMKRYGILDYRKNRFRLIGELNP